MCFSEFVTAGTPAALVLVLPIWMPVNFEGGCGEMSLGDDMGGRDVVEVTNAVNCWSPRDDGGTCFRSGTTGQGLARHPTKTTSTGKPFCGVVGGKAPDRAFTRSIRADTRQHLDERP